MSYLGARGTLICFDQLPCGRLAFTLGRRKQTEQQHDVLEHGAEHERRDRVRRRHAAARRRVARAVVVVRRVDDRCDVERRAEHGYVVTRRLKEAQLLAVRARVREHAQREEHGAHEHDER